VRDCVSKAGGHSHILNLGHGVIQPTPEEAVRVFVDEAKKFKYRESTRFWLDTSPNGRIFALHGVRIFVDEAKKFKYADIPAYQAGNVKELVA
ncbi:hypothetical protein T484DRAFT_1847718, partial [Baffinella frigidus]